MKEIDSDHTIRDENLAGKKPSSDHIWQTGKVILDNYVIKQKLGQGGMGNVYLVERTLSHDILKFAVKTLPEDTLHNAQTRIALLRELGTWMDIPDHPNITACRFFRSIGDNLAIFSEYVDGGTLEKWIQDKCFKNLEEKLDIALQISWGLNTAHSRNVIHQDVKPANILMTSDGIPKITDFGLSRLKGSGQIAPHNNARGTILVTGGGYTPAYCSPEQASGDPISRRTDIWSWGIVILQMILGERTWKFGLSAPLILDHLKENRNFPPQFIEFLDKCFRTEPDERWRSMETAATALAEILHKLTGRESRQPPDILPEPEPETFDLFMGVSAVSHRNAQEWLKRVQDLSDSDDKEDTFYEESSEVSTQTARLLMDLERFERAVFGMQALIFSGKTDLESEITDLLVNKAAVHESIGDFHGAMRLYEHALTYILQILENKRETNTTHRLKHAEILSLKGRIATLMKDYPNAERFYGESIHALDAIHGNSAEYAHIRGLAMINLAYCLMKRKHYQQAESAYDNALNFFQKILKTHPQLKFKAKIANALENKGLIRWMRGLPESALEFYREAEEMWLDLCEEESSEFNRYFLATTISNRSLVYLQMGQFEDAYNGFLETTKVLESIKTSDIDMKISESLTVVWNNLALAAEQIDRMDEANKYLSKSSDLLETLYYQKGRQDFGSELVRNITIKARFAGREKDFSTAIGLYSRSITMMEQMIYRDDRRDLYPELIRYYWEKGFIELEIKRTDDALKTYNTALQILEHVLNHENMPLYRADAEWIRLYKAEALHALGRTKEAQAIHAKSLEIIQKEMKRTGRTDLNQALEYAEKLKRKLHEHQ